jgi:hypothetical protein
MSLEKATASANLSIVFLGTASPVHLRFCVGDSVYNFKSRHSMHISCTSPNWSAELEWALPAFIALGKTGK